MVLNTFSLAALFFLQLSKNCIVTHSCLTQFSISYHTLAYTNQWRCGLRGAYRMTPTLCHKLSRRGEISGRWGFCFLTQPQDPHSAVGLLVLALEFLLYTKVQEDIYLVFHPQQMFIAYAKPTVSFTLLHTLWKQIKSPWSMKRCKTMKTRFSTKAVRSIKIGTNLFRHEYIIR